MQVRRDVTIVQVSFSICIKYCQSVIPYDFFFLHLGINAVFRTAFLAQPEPAGQ